MSDDWDFYALRVDGDPASIFVDLGLRHEAPLLQWPVMGYVRVYMRQPRPDGLSSEDEFPRLIEIEDALQLRCRDHDDAVFVGRNTSSGNRDHYFYTGDATRFEAGMRSAMAAFPEYDFDVGSRKDPGWSTYFDFLMPRPRDMERIMSRRVCEQLKQKGDDLAKPRQVDHLAYFPDRAARDDFAGRLPRAGFVVAHLADPDDRLKDWTVAFHRVDAPDGIDAVVLPLFDKVTELGGVYDGWGCEVMP